MPRYHQPSQVVRLRRIGAPSPAVSSGFRWTTSSAARAASDDDRARQQHDRGEAEPRAGATASAGAAAEVDGVEITGGV